MRDRAGQRIGDYVLGPPLGSGAMGGVYRAEHAETRACVAIKLLREIDADARLRFQREGEAQAAVDRHPNVLSVHSAGVDGGQPYLVMDLAPGGSLAHRLAKGPLPIPEAVAIARDLAWGLEHVHQHGVLHRDLKPQNILFGADGRPMLGDFGLARIAGARSLTETGDLIGTPAYMAPEQASSDRAAPSPQTDVYGLGAILYAMLTGGPPFLRGSTIAILHAVLHDAPTPVAKLRPEVDRHVEAICSRCLEKAPSQRYATAKALADELTGWLDGQRSPSASSRPVGVLAVATLMIAVLLAWGVAPPPPPAPPPAPADAASPVAPVASSTPPPPTATTGRLEGEPTILEHRSSSSIVAGFISARRFVTLGIDRGLRYWTLDSAGTPRETRSVKLEGSGRTPDAIAVSDDGTVVVGYTDGEIVWALPSSQHLVDFRVESMDMTRDRARLAAGYGDEIRLYDGQTRKRSATYMTEGSRTVVKLLLFADGTHLAALMNKHSDQDWAADQLHVFDLASGERQVIVMPAAPARCLAFRSETKTLIVGTNVGELLQFGLDGEYLGPITGTTRLHQVLSPRAHGGSLRGMVYAPSSDLMYSVAHGDLGKGDEVCVWDGTRELQRVERAVNPNGIALSPDGRTLLVPTRSATVEVWRLR